jgi:hypothetical protein
MQKDSMTENEVVKPTQDVVEPVAETVQESAAPVVQAAPKVDSDKDYNMAQLRRQAETAQLERDNMAREIESIRAQLAPKQAEEPEYHVAPDDFVEGKHLSAYDKKLRKLETELQQSKQESANTAAEALIRAKCPDFDSVVTPQSLQELQENHPEIAATLATNKNLQTQALAAYKIIKQLKSKPDYNAEQAIIDKNQSKPKPVAILQPQHSDSPLTHANAFANGLTDSLKQQLNREMEDAIRNR